MQLQIRGKSAVARELFQKVSAARICLGTGAQGGVKVMPPVADADRGELIRRETEQSRAQYGDQRHVLVGVVDDGEHREHHAHLGRAPEPAALRGVHRDAPRRERLSIDRADRVGAAQQDHHVAPVRAALAVAVAHQCAAVDHRPDALRDPVGFERRLFCRGTVVRVRQLQETQLRRLAAARRFQPALELRVLVIVKLPELAGHDVFEHEIRRVKDAAPGAEILLQQDAPCLAGLRGLRGGEAVVFFQKDRRVREPEAIDRLLHVSDEEEVRFRAGHGAEDEILHLAHVLVFVYHDLAEALGHAPRQSRGRAAFIGEDPRREMLQVRVVHEGAALLFFLIGIAEFERQPQQALHRGGGLAQIRKQGLRLRGELLLQLLDHVFAAVALCLDAVLEFRVGRVFHRAHTREPDRADRVARGVPALPDRAAGTAHALAGGVDVRDVFVAEPGAVGGGELRHEPVECV